MHIIMKHMFIKTSVAILASLALLSCAEKEKTIMQEPQTLTLNTPVYSSSLVDLETSTGVELTCAGQPDYGFNCPCEYIAEASFSEIFTEGSYITLSTKSTDPHFYVDAAELAAGLTTLSGLSEDIFPIITPVYFRVKAVVKRNTDAAVVNNEIGAIYSNVVCYNQVRLHYALAAFKAPTKMSIIGAFCSWSWDSSFDMIPEWYDTAKDPIGTFWRLMYVPDECGMKFNIEKAWDGNEQGFEAVKNRITDEAGAGVKASDDGNIVFENGGWYLVIIKTAIVGRTYEFSLEVKNPDVYLFGACNGGAWEAKDEWKFSVPADETGDFVSPAFAADGEVRATVLVDPANWWHSEFLVFGNQLVYRGTGPDQERVSANAGQKISINFTNGTGSIN